MLGSVGLSVIHLRSKTGLRTIAGISVIASMYVAFSLNQNWRLACLYLEVSWDWPCQ